MSHSLPPERQGEAKWWEGSLCYPKRESFVSIPFKREKKLKTHSEVLFSFLRETKPHFKPLRLYRAGVCSLAIDNFHSIISLCCCEPGHQGLSPARWKPPQGRKSRDSLALCSKAQILLSITAEPSTPQNLLVSEDAGFDPG